MKRVHLRREFENFSPAARTLCFRWSAGQYEVSHRGKEPSLTDVRGPNVQAIETVQTFLSSPQVDELVGLYEDGMTIAQVSEKLGVHRHTVMRHLVHRGVQTRPRGLSPEHVTEAAQMYQDGLTLMEVGQNFGVSAQAVRRAISAAGVQIRPQGRNRHLVG